MSRARVSASRSVTGWRAGWRGQFAGMRWSILLIPAVAVFALYFILPMLGLFQRSLEGGSDPSWSANYVEAFKSELVRTIFLRTLKTAAIVSAVCLALGYPYAYLMTIASKRWRTVMIIVVLIPFWTSLMVRTFAWQILLRDQGVVNDLLESIGLGRHELYKNLLGVTVGMSHILLPFAVLPMFTTMAGVDRRLLLAAQSLGATPFTGFRKVYLPLSLPGVVSGLSFVFVLSLGFFITPQLLGSPQDSLISQYMYGRIDRVGRTEYAAAIGFILLVVALLILAAVSRIARPNQAYASGMVAD